MSKESVWVAWSVCRDSIDWVARMHGPLGQLRVASPVSSRPAIG